MSAADVICRVQALYSYRSDDPSSLSFDPNSVIDVFTQLDSGWWDGCFNGKRGWFPSNYVKVISDDFKAQLNDQTQTKQADNPTIRSSDRPKTDWILQTTEDGSEQYYYNTRTEEMKYGVPLEGYLDEKTQLVMDNNSFWQSKPSVLLTSNTFGPPPVRPVRAASRIIAAEELAQFQKSTEEPVQKASLTTPVKQQQQQQQHQRSSKIEKQVDFEDDKLPPNWERKTAKGRYYYYNTKTHETTSELENIDIDTGVLMLSLPNYFQDLCFPNDNLITPKSKGITKNIYEPPLSLENTASALDDNNIVVLWKRSLSTVTDAIHKLNESILREDHSCFIEHASNIVHQIRSFLYASDCMDKETSHPLKVNKQLRRFHRSLVASLANLVLSAKVASNVWPKPEYIIKLKTDLDDLLIAAVDFVTCAQELCIEVKDSKPVLTHDKSIWNTFTIKNNNRIMIGTSDYALVITVLAENVRGAINSFKENIGNVFASYKNKNADGDLAKLELDVPSLIAQFRNISNTTSQLVNAIKEVCLSHQENPGSVALANSKQPINAAMGSLFVISQALTSPDLAGDQVQDVHDRFDKYIKTIETSVQAVIECTAKLIHEKIIQKQHNINNGTRSNKVTSAALTTSVQSSIPKSATFHKDDIASTQKGGTYLYTPFTPLTSTTNTALTSSGTSNHNKIAADGTDTPWYLTSDIDPNEIVYSKGIVKGGSLRSLVQYLTRHDRLDSTFNSAFMITWRSFCTSTELFHELIQRYNIFPPDGINAEELTIWKEKKRKFVRLRVFNIIKTWLEIYFHKEEDGSVLPGIIEFTESIDDESMKFGAEQINELAKKRLPSESSSPIRKMKASMRRAEQSSIHPKQMKLLGLQPLEQARQMTLMDFELYSKIEPIECVDKNWSKPEVEGSSRHIAANIKALIEHSNQVTAWVADSILSMEFENKRVAVVKHWINVADQCKKMNNFNTCMAILSALDNASIGRLKRTWDSVDSSYIKTLKESRQIMGSEKNFSKYRDAVCEAKYVCIPFLGMYLKDLTFIEDGNAKFIQIPNKLINFAKYSKIAEVIQDLQRHKSNLYKLDPVPDIQKFIKDQLCSSREEEELYTLSLKLEPRKDGDATFARRLKESGL